MQPVDHLIIGGGVAGTTAAETIRKLDANCTITIVSEELYPLYSRVLLPHYIRGKVKREFVFLKKDAWYDEHHVDLKKGRVLATLRPDVHEAVLDDGTEYHYQKILLATGGRVRKLELPQLGGITYFRTIDDADMICEELAACATLPEAERVGFIYGSGFIGLEYAPLFREAGLETHLAMRGDRYWSAYLDDASEQLLTKILTDQDIHLHRGVGGVKVEGSEHLWAVDIFGTRLPARIMGVGVGLLPNFEAIAAAGIATNRGVLADEYLRTSVPDVLTAGDISEFMDVTVGRHRILGNWINAQQQGMCAGANMVGELRKFEVVSAYSTSPFGISITFVGDVSRLIGTKVVVRGTVESRGVSQVFVRDHRVVGATLINMNRERLPLTELIREKRDVRGLEAKLADPAVDMKTLLN